MKAAFIEKFGGPEVLTYGDLPDPSPGPGQVVVDVVAASVNAADWKVVAGEYKQATFPLVIGRDFSGTVAAVKKYRDARDLPGYETTEWRVWRELFRGQAAD